MTHILGITQDFDNFHSKAKKNRSNVIFIVEEKQCIGILH